MKVRNAQIKFKILVILYLLIETSQGYISYIFRQISIMDYLKRGVYIYNCQGNIVVLGIKDCFICMH